MTERGTHVNPRAEHRHKKEMPVEVVLLVPYQHSVPINAAEQAVFQPRLRRDCKKALKQFSSYVRIRVEDQSRRLKYHSTLTTAVYLWSTDKYE